MHVASQFTPSKVLILACFTLILFLATFDNSAVDGIVPLLQEHFNINDAQTATIRTSTSVAHTITLAIIWMFGYAFERRKLFLFSVTAWIVLSLLSFILGSNSFLILVAFRALAEVASSISGVLVPVMVADLFEDRALGIAFMFITSTELLGNQLIGILNSWIISSGTPWQVALMPGPLLTLAPLIGLACISGKFWSSTSKQKTLRKSFTNAFSLFSNKSFILLTASSCTLMFHRRAFMFWFPTMVLNGWTAFPDVFFGSSYTTVTTLISVSKISASLIALPLFLWFAQSWRHATGPFSWRECRYDPAYPVVVAIGSTIYAVVLGVVFILVEYSYVLFLVCLFVAFAGAAASISLGQQMMMMVVPTSSRPAALSLSVLISAIFTTPAAQLFGLVSDAYRGDSTLPYDRFRSYQFALLISLSFAAACALCYVLLAFTFGGDCRKAEEKDKEEVTFIDEHSALLGSSKELSQSVLDLVSRSKATTLNADSLF